MTPTLSTITPVPTFSDGANYYTEHCMVISCAEELFNFTKENGRHWHLFEYMMNGVDIKNGVHAEVIKLYRNNELVGFTYLDNFENLDTKFFEHNHITYQDLGVVHFMTNTSYRGMGFGTFLAKTMYQQILTPLFARNKGNTFITATGKAVPLMLRSGLDNNHLAREFFSQESFKEKVVNTWKNVA